MALLMGKEKNQKTLFYRGKYYDPRVFANRDLSWWEFNRRVLHEAVDPRTPLLERLKFIDIYRSNSDEFFMKRLGLMLHRIELDDPAQSLDGLTMSELFERIMALTHELNLVCIDHLTLSILPELAQHGIKLYRFEELKPEDLDYLAQEFKKNIFPLLTPLAVDPGHPFPFLSNQSKSIGVCLKKPRASKRQFARVKVPSDISQWVQLPPTRQFAHRFARLDEIIAHHLDLLFPGMKVEGSMTFKILRDAVIDDDDDADDIMDFVEEGLRERKFAPIVRLEYDVNGDPWILRYLKEELSLTANHCVALESFLPQCTFSRISGLHYEELKYPPHRPRLVNALNYDERGIEIFDHIKKEDQLVHFPYQSYRGTVESFLTAAVNDPTVRAIKIVLYRTDDDGRLIKLLIQAAENKKQVACVIELKARFDEERNIKWANALEEAGIHVSYGLVGVKTHAKLILVVRQEKKGLVPYGYIGTGNFNSKTARLYTDLGLFTTNKTLCADIGQVFNYLTGTAVRPKIQKLLVAPFSMEKKFLTLIEREIAHAKNKRPAGIVAKMNSLEDPEIVMALYRASQAGVDVRLIVRGFCCLKPQVKGLSENIWVTSLVGRFLEHHRIYYFRNGATQPEEGLFYFGSADWMYRNLNERIEVITPVESKKCRKRLLAILNTTLLDNRHQWELLGNQTYRQRAPKSAKQTHNAQDLFCGDDWASS